MKKIFTLCVVLCLSYLTMGASTPKHEFRATWLTTAWGNDWPKTKATNDATREQQKQELIDILDKMKAGNLNAVCFQVRSLCDAMYQSSYEPWSIALTGTRGKDPGYDPLQFAIDEAHKRGMELHVWVNPFRASTSTLAATDMLWDNAGDWLIKYNNSSFSGYLIDPGYPESRAYVVKVLMEIINKYDVDGLVMDDYFYAYGGTTNQDSVAQALHYRASEVIDVNNNGNKIDDWRRSNVDNVIKAMYDSIQVVKPWVRFGMGPGGIWTTDSKAASAYGISLPSGISGSDIYNVLYCNTVEWIKGGYVDYVNPQIYWSTQVAAQDYDVLCQWWSTSVCEHFSNQLPNQKRVHHFPSLATYKAIQKNDGTYYSGYSDGYVEIQRELDANRKNLSSGYTGAVFYNTTSYLQMSEELAESHFTHTALAPPMEWKVKGDLAAPTNLQLSGTTLSWQHPTAERFTVYAYPKGIGVNTATSNPQYLQAVVYDKSFNTSSLGSLDDITIAVYTYDRYGVEHGVVLYNADPNATDDPEPEPEPEPEPSNTITWELNGGEVNTVTVEVPTQSGLMLQFMNDYVAYFGTPTIDVDAFHPTGNMTGFLYRGKNTREKSVNEMILDETAGWKWLADYIVSTSASNPTIVAALNSGTEVNWRYSIAAFFEQNGSGTYNVDFSTAGQPAAWGSTYQVAHGMVLLPTYVTSAYTLPTPTHPEGLTFLGWYDNPAFSGSSLTIIPAHWTGTLYAKWQEDTPTIDPTWQITYTSTDGNIVTPTQADVFGANIVSNTYENGVGTITFDGPVTSIGFGAFDRCPLISITIPNRVTSIGEGAFYRCYSLTSITIPNSVTSIGDEAFRGCSGLTSITIPNSVTSIGVWAFYGCSGLTSITIPNSVTSIGNDAFYGCSGLTSVTIPSSVTSIGRAAFYGCSGLTSITIPNSVTSIGGDAFSGCSSLTSVTINSNDIVSREYTYSSNIGTIFGSQVTEYVIGNSVTCIGKYAFRGCSSLTSITIPNSVTSIGDEAFRGCSGLTSITIPNSVTSIGVWAFYGCSGLTSITIPNSVTSIGDRAFYGCSGLTKTNYMGDVAGWCDIKFGDSSANPISESHNLYVNDVEIKDLVIPNTVDSIHNYAFCACSSLASITIPNSVTSIGDYAFYGCIFIKENFINNSSLDAESNNYWSAKVGNVEIDGLLIRNDTVIACQPYVTTATIPNSVTSIGVRAFEYCSSLASITIPNSVTSIGFRAFEYCSSLASITIPNSVTSIGDRAFYDCSALTKTNYTGDVAGWCDIKFSDYSANPISESHNFYINDVEIKDLVIPNTVDSIHNYAFCGCSSLASITIPNSVTSIGDYAFEDCSSLTSVTIPNSVTSIGNYAFYDCSSLPSITIPNSVTSIGEYAFYHCEYLTSIYLPYNIPIVNQSSFNDYHYEQVKLYVPLEAYEAYKADDVWGKFKNILYINNFYENNIRYSYIMDGEVLSASLLTEENFNKFTPISLIGSQNWHYDSKYGAKMSGYSDATQTTYSNEDWLISPALDLSKHSSATLTFSHAFGPAASVPTTATQKAQYTCWISNDFNGDVTIATWTELPITYGTSAWSYITTTVDIPAENLKENCHIAWKYVCTTSSATWEIKSVEIGGSYTRPVVKVIAKNDKYSNDVVIPSVVTHNYTDYSVETIAANAFSSCPSLTSITIGNNVKSIENYAFESCSSLTSVILGGKIETIGKNAFSGCTALNEITLPTSVKSIGENAFAGCTKLYDIYCFAMEPPTAYESSFANYNAFLHVPCDNQRVYLLDVIFGNFKYIECIEAETTPTDTVVVTPSFNDAEFIWPSNSSADGYTLAISKDGEVFCTLTFNANGQLTGIAFAPSRNGQHNAPAAAQLANGFAFTVTGLDEGANYTYDLLIQDRSGNTLQSYSGEFRTQSTNDRTVTVEYDAAQGQVTGAGVYQIGDTVTLTAVPNDGYHFVQWSDGNTDNPRTLVLTQDTILTAEFALTISGQCGDNLYWAYDEASKTIAITGSGDMYDYTKDTQPWLLFQDQITEVTTSNTTTSIGDWAFDDCSGLTSVTIGNSVTSIGEQAFNGCSSLTSITIPNSVTSIGEGAFEYCSSLDTIHVEATTPPALEDSTVFMNTPSPVCVIPCGTLATYQSSDWANQVGSFVEDCPPASAAITYVLNGGVQSEWETPQTMYNELNAVWNAFSGTSKTWGNLEDLKANVANGIPTQAGTMALDFIADENFKAKFEWLVTYMDAKCTEQGQTLPSSNASFLRYNLQAFFIDGMRTSWPISADYTICGVSTVEAYQPYWKSGFANPTNPTEEFILNAPYREGYTFAGWYTTPDFSGEKVTTINAETTGTLYAKWINSDWIITYTSTDGNIVTPYKTDVFGANIVSNIYEDGVGTITFDGPVTSIGDYAFYCFRFLTSITIPNSVTSIGDYAFSGCTSLASVVIPESVKSIGAVAFSGCTSLTSVTIPNSVTSIGDSAFSGCTSLTSVVIPESVTSIGDWAFSDCTSLTSIAIPNSVESIGDWAFSGCTSLTSVVIPESVTSIGDWAFSDCTSLTSITIPNSVTSIGDRAFSGCTSLTSIAIPNSVESIGYEAFRMCYSLTSMVVEPGNTTYDSRENCNAIIEKATNTLIAGCQNTIIPNSVTSIGDNAFADCTSLTSVVIPESVTSIGDWAFTYCTSLASVVIPESVTSIGDWAFNDCTSLTSIAIPNSVESIGYEAFRMCYSLTSITIPNSVTSIGDWAFYGCHSLTSITIPESVTSIGYNAFDGCTSLTSITCEATTPPTLGSTVFPSELTTAYIPCGTKAAYEVSDWAQYVSEFIEEGCPKITYELNGGLPNEYGWQNKNDMFQACMADCGVTTLPSLDEIKATGNDAALTTICTKLTDVSGMLNSDKWEWLEQYIMEVQNAQVGNVVGSSFVPAITTTSGAVYWRYALAAFFVDGQRTAWPYSADFSQAGKDEAYIPAWKQVYTYPTSVTSEFTLYDPYRKGYTFLGWYANTDFSGEKVTTINAETTGTLYAKWINNDWIITYTSTDGNIVTPYATDVFGANIVSNTYENGVGTITFDGPVTSIGGFAFDGCSNLASLTIPNSITNIGRAAFQECSSLTSITIPNSVTSIGDFAFGGCSSLTSITIPNSVISIGERAFVRCYSLTAITIPNSVTNIGESAFTWCSSLDFIIVEEGNAIFDSRNNCNAIIETITNTLVQGCSGTTIPNSVINIGDRAFAHCNIISIIIPKNVMSIGYAAFGWCENLETVHIESTTPPILDSTWTFSPYPICYIPCGSLAAYEASAWASQVGEFVEEGCAPIQKCGDDLFWKYADGVLTIIGSGDMYDYADDKTGPAPWYDVRGSIKAINMPDEMTKIGDYAFYKCTALTSVTLPKQLKHIGNRAFAQDTKIAGNIVIPEGVNYIEERAFFNLTGVSQFQVLATTPPTLESTNVFTNVNAPIVIPCGYGLVYRKANIWKDLNLSTCEVLIDNLYYMPVGDNEAHIIGYDNKPAGTLTIPGSIVIGSKTRTVTTLADSLFFDCKEISSVIFNEGLESIGERAFVRSGLTGTIVLPSTLTTIGERAFSYCDNVEKYILQAMTPPALANDVFTGSNSKALFYISCEAMDDYKVATNWSSLKSRLRDACLNIYHYNTALGANGVHTTEDTLVASIYYRRQFTTSRWETLYLPFEVDRVTVLEDGVEYDLNAWSIFGGGHYYLAKPYGIENKEVVFGFTQVVDAHIPYIIQFKDEYYRDKIITFYSEESWNKLSTSFEMLSSSFEMQMAGNTTLQDQTLEKPVYMLRATSNFILQNTTTTLHPFECYVMPYATPSGTPARMNVRLRDDVPTAVESVKGNESHLTYSVDGYTLTVYPQGQAFSIYSLNGALIYSCEAGKEAVDCELNSGCYLLHAGTEAHKIML